jgi:D-glycero-D-manno-heptose 1,7-bisphosphate phosphatase
MIEKACARYRIEPGASWMIGDKTRDIEAGENAGVRGILMPVNGDLIDCVPQMLASHV